MVAAVSDVGVCGLQIKGRTSVATASDKPDDEAAHNAAHAFPTRTDQHPDSDQDTAEADWHRWSAPALAPVPVNGVRCHCASVWVGNLYSFFTEPAACNGNLSAHLLMRLALLCGLVGNVKLIYNFPASHFNFSCCQHASCLLFHFAFCIFSLPDSIPLVQTGRRPIKLILPFPGWILQAISTAWVTRGFYDCLRF